MIIDFNIATASVQFFPKSLKRTDGRKREREGVAIKERKEDVVNVIIFQFNV